MTAAYLACLALGYLIGSLSVSILISKYIFHQDVRTLGSGNAGAANAARTLGAGVGLLTLLGDFLKGVISMLLGSCLGGATGLAIAGAACMIGHCFPIYFGFKGGKAVATAAAVALMIDWRVFLSAFAVFAIAGCVYLSYRKRKNSVSTDADHLQHINDGHSVEVKEWKKNSKLEFSIAEPSGMPNRKKVHRWFPAFGRSSG